MKTCDESFKKLQKKGLNKMQQQAIRTTLEAIFLKSFINHSLTQKELEPLNR